jgi:Tetratricopeptide repeat/NACHT domain
VYQKLQPEPLLQASLLNIFSEVVEFSVLAWRYFSRNTVIRLVRQVQCPFEKEFGEILQRLDRHSNIVDKTALAVEMVKASEYRKTQEHAAQAALKLQIESWMKVANMRMVHEAQLKNKLHGTCEWIWNNHVFTEWARLSSQTPSDRLLIVHGTHGCGKSTLASAIVSRCRAQGTRCLFFAFSGSVGSRQTSESLIRSCLWQMVQYAPESNGLNVLTDLMAKYEPLEDDFWAAMSTISAKEPVWVVIDGVDESSGSCDVLIQRIVGLLAEKLRFRTIILGRSYVLTRTIHNINFSVEMSSDVTKQDIDAYITAGIRRDTLLSENDLKDTFSDTLKNKAGGMFLWAKLMIDHLGRSANRDEAFKRLGDVPQGLEMAYIIILTRLIDQLDFRDLSFVKNILEVVIIARRPLRIEEARIAHALVSGTGSTYLERLDTRLEQKIFELCGGLIVIVNGHLNVVHFSLTELLTRHTEYWPHNKSAKSHEFSVDINRAHQNLGVGCLRYLGTLDYGSPLHDANAFSELPRRHKFLDYTARHILDHLRFTDISEIVPSLIGFVLSEGFISSMEYFTMIFFAMTFELVPGIYAINEKLDIWLKQEDGLNQEPLATKWIDTGRHIITKLKNKTATVRQRSVSGVFLRFVKNTLLEVPGWGIFDDVSTQLARIQIDTGDSEDDTEIYLPFRSSEYGGSSDEDSETSTAAREPKAFTIIKLGAPKALQEEPSTAQLLPLPLVPRLQGSPMIAVEEQIRILFQMAFSFEPMEELERRAVFQNLVEQAAIFAPITLCMLGYILSSNDLLDQAIELCSIAYSRAEKHDRSAMDDIAILIDNLLYDEGRLAESEVFCRKVASDFNDEFGGEHECTLRWLRRLSISLRDQDKYKEAEVHIRKVWEIRKQTLGENHRDTLDSARDLSLSLEDGDESEALCRQVKDRREVHLGRADRDTLESYKDLLQHYIKKEPGEETEQLYWEILDLHRLQLGDEHENTRNAAWDLVGYLKEIEKYDIAEAVCLRLLKIERKLLGDQNECTLETAAFLKQCLKKQRKYDAIEHLDRTIFKSFRTYYSIGHEKTLKAASSLVDTLFKNGKDLEAEKFLLRLLNIDRSIIARKIYWWSHFAFEFGILLYRQEKWTEAEDIFRNILSTLRENEHNWVSKADIDDNSSENSSRQGEGGEGGDDEDDELFDYFISDILQELAFVLNQQGQEEEAIAIKEELTIKEAAGRRPSPWLDIN